MPPLSSLPGAVASGSSGGVIGGILGDIGANASRQAKGPGGAGSAGAAGTIKDLPGAIADAFGGLFGALQEQSSIGRNPSLFSRKGAASSEQLSSLQSVLEAISEKLSEMLKAPPNAPMATPAPQVHIAAPAAQSHSAAPASVESPYPDLGPNPFMDAPSGSGPTGSFGFNPNYFPTQATAQKIADMLGGKVFSQNAILSSPGSPFHQNQMNYMVELPNGNVINPGFIAQAIASGQPRNTIDAMIYSEVNNVGVAVGQAPAFVPVNRPAQSAAAPAASSSSATSQAAPVASWSNIDQMRKDTQLVAASDPATPDAAILALREKMDRVNHMLQVLAQLLSIRAEKLHSA